MFFMMTYYFPLLCRFELDETRSSGWQRVGYE